MIFTQACHINLSVKLAIEDLTVLSWLWSCLVVTIAVVAKTWIECEFVAKALNLSMRLLRKDALSMKLLWKPELSINIYRESLYVINVAFGYEKNNPARKAVEKNNRASILSEKKFSARTKIPRPPPPPPWISNGPCLTGVIVLVCRRTSVLTNPESKYCGLYHRISF